MDYYNFSDRPSPERISEIAQQFNLHINPDSAHLYLNFQQTYREVEKSYNHLLEKFDLSESRFTILMFLIRAKDRQLLPSEIADKLGVARPTASKLVKGLINQGLVTSAPSSLDKRMNFIKITNSGAELLNTFLPYNYRAVDELFTDFTVEEKDQFLILLKKLRTGKDKIQLLEETINGNS